MAVQRPAGAHDEVAFPVLTNESLADIAEFGRVEMMAAGDRLYQAGDVHPSFFVVLEGEVEIVRLDHDSEDLIATHPAGRFVGELSLLTGQRTFLTARATRPGRVLVITPSEFRRLMASKPTLADTIFAALVARRELVRSGDAALAVRIIGSRYSSEALALRSFATRTRVPFTWIDLDDAADVGVLLASMGVRPTDTPVVITPNALLRHPTPGELAEHLGLTFHPTPGRTFDLVVVGTGPAGLAAAVSGASEGLETLALDSTAIGGQAGTSSRIENYVGFPNGISGGDLAAAAAIQAQRLGARLANPCEVDRLIVGDGFHVMRLTDGSEIPARAVIIATGARYQRLAVDRLGRFEGRGVYYAATELEARVCAGSDVLVVGGGNSAGQAAIFLSSLGCRVTITIRREDLATTMSRYLIERVDADPRIDLLCGTEVRALGGHDHLETVTVERTATRRRRDMPCSGLFCFIGAKPSTTWLDGAVALDDRGFVLTDRLLNGTELTDPQFVGRAPLPFETSVAGVFAAGDARSGSLKRVAAAVGEGTSAVRSVHDYLATHA